MTIAEICYTIAGTNNHEGAEAVLASLMDNDSFALAYGLVSEGFSVIPLCPRNKVPARKWKEFQTRIATVEELKDWFIDHDFVPGIVTGELSGITVIDCDSDDAIDLVEEAGLESTMMQTTRRGMHLVFRHNGERNTVSVARMPGVDRRGEGGYVKAYPGSAHWTREQVSYAPILEERFA